MNIRIRSVFIASVVFFASTTVARTAASADVAVPAGYSQSPSTIPMQMAVQMLGSGNYAGLDALLDDAWRGHPVREDGIGALQPMMAALTYCAPPCPLQDDDQFNRAIAPLQAWEAKTHSVHAQVAIAWLTFHRAWAIRGGGLAANVTQQQWQGFREELATAQARLDAAPDKLGQYPPAALLRLKLARERPDARTAFPPLYAAISKQFPDDLQILSTMIRFNSAGWGGSTAKVRDFIAETADGRPQPDSDILYTRLQWQNEQPEAFVSGLIDWTRMKKGWLALLERYPHPWNVANAVRHACLAEDFDFPSAVRAAVGDAVYAHSVADASRSLGCGRYPEWPDGRARVTAPPPAASRSVEAPTTAEYAKVKRALLDSGLAFHCEAVERVVHASMTSWLASLKVDTTGLTELDAFKAEMFCESVAIATYGQLAGNSAGYFDRPEQFFSSPAGRHLSELLREERNGPSMRDSNEPASGNVQTLILFMGLSDDFTVTKLFADMADLHVADGGLDVRDTLRFAELRTPHAQELMEGLSGRALSRLTDAEFRQFEIFASSPEGSEFLGQRRSRASQILKDSCNALVAATRARMP